MAGDVVTMGAEVWNGADRIDVEVLDSDGSVVFSESLSPDENGMITFQWFALVDGVYTISATSYLGEFLLGSETVSLVSAVRPDARGFITGGGWFHEGDGRSTFGLVAQVLGNGTVRGNLEFQDHPGGNNWKSTNVDWVYAPSRTEGYFSGTLRRNGQGSYRFFVEVRDLGEPGRSDWMKLWVYDPITGEVAFHYSGELDGGNIQIHGR